MSETKVFPKHLQRTSLTVGIWFYVVSLHTKPRCTKTVIVVGHQQPLQTAKNYSLLSFKIKNQKGDTTTLHIIYI